MSDIVPDIDIEAVGLRCTLGIISGQQCYEAFADMGLQYGGPHRSLHSLMLGSGEVLADIRLDATSDFLLHPGGLDCALQAVIGLAHDFSGQTPGLPAAVPFALERCEIFGPIRGRIWAVARDIGQEGGMIRRDIDLCDIHGRVLVRLHGLTNREMILPTEPTPKLIRNTSAATETLYFSPQWADVPASKSSVTAYDKKVILLCGLDHVSPVALETRLSAHCTPVSLNDLDADDAFDLTARLLMTELQAIMEARPKGNVLVQVVVSSGSMMAGVSGMLQTARQEHPRIYGQVIIVDDVLESDDLAELLAQDGHCPDDREISWVGGVRQVRTLQELSMPEAGKAGPWRNDGVYLISGGAGGLGWIFAQAIRRGCPDAWIVLSGRSRADDPRLAARMALIDADESMEYRSVDVADPASVDAVLQEIITSHGHLDGIVHGAGTLRDSLLPGKSTEDLSAVLSPKVSGVVNLDRATMDMELDCFILFGSGAGLLGNVGQADYAAANAFLGEFAHARNLLADAGKRHGRCLCIHWPLWANGGMQLDLETEMYMREQTGMVPLEDDAGIDAFNRSWQAGLDAVLVLEGERAGLMKVVGSLSRLITLDSLNGLNDDDFYHQLVRKISEGELSADDLNDVLVLQ